MSYEIDKTLVLSTAHVSPETAELLNGGSVISNDAITLLSGPLRDEYGWNVWVETEDAPDDLKHVLAFAVELDCRYVRLDCDGPEINFLPTWEW